VSLRPSGGTTGLPAHPVKQAFLACGAGRGLPGGSGEEPVSGPGIGGRFSQAVIDLVEVIAGPRDQARAENVAGADGSREIPGVDDGVSGPDGKRLLAGHLAEGVIEHLLKGTGTAERRGAFPHGPGICAGRIRA
jgi:hypothetical protein